jgi:Ca2+/Na+ antiporter
MFALHVHQHNDFLGHLMTMEVTTANAQVHDAWVEAICNALNEQKRSTREDLEHAPSKSLKVFINEWIDWFQFPVKSLSEVTIPDMDNPSTQKWYPVAFVMSMAWLAVFAFLVVFVCDGIHADFGISTAVLGFTVAAAGTSFPNVFSGIVVSRQGKTTMAIANALGANIQNVFIALAIPWSIQCFFIHGGHSFNLHVADLTVSAIECGITLLPLVITFASFNGTLPRWSGKIFLVVYVIYVIVSLGQESSHCMRWPFQCSMGSSSGHHVQK